MLLSSSLYRVAPVREKRRFGWGVSAGSCQGGLSLSKQGEIRKDPVIETSLPPPSPRQQRLPVYYDAGYRNACANYHGRNGCQAIKASQCSWDAPEPTATTQRKRGEWNTAGPYGGRPSTSASGRTNSSPRRQPYASDGGIRVTGGRRNVLYTARDGRGTQKHPSTPAETESLFKDTQERGKTLLDP